MALFLKAFAGFCLSLLLALWWVCWNEIAESQLTYILNAPSLSCLRSQTHRDSFPCLLTLLSCCFCCPICPIWFPLGECRGFDPGQAAADKLIEDPAREEQPNEGAVGGRAVCQVCAVTLP